MKQVKLNPDPKPGRPGRRFRRAALLAWLVAFGAPADEPLPIVDVHVHYNEDAWEIVSPRRAISLLREAGLDRALVSSSGDAGTLLLQQHAPRLVIPVLRPYRGRGEQSRWMHDATVVDLLERKLEAGVYAGIGEFHADGAQIDLPVVQRLIELAGNRGLFLHAHADVDAIHRIYASDPRALVLWAHAGFVEPAGVETMLRKYPNLWVDLAIRDEIAFRDEIDAAWRDLFERFPDRFMLGSDTYTPTRWFQVGEHADWARAWLRSLPREIAEKIAFGNADALLQRVNK